MVRLLASVAALAALAAPASAATVSRDGDAVVITGGTTITVESSAVDDQDRVTIQNSKAPDLTAGAGCQGGGYSVVCPESGFARLLASFGDGDDHFGVLVPPDVRLDVSTGAGNDLLTVRGGNGRDVIDGGPGADFLGYGGSAGVTIRLDGGPGGEDDLQGIEAVSGGSGDDLLVGGAGPDRLSGGPGRDRVEAGGGGRDGVDCGGQPDDVAIVDGADEEGWCGHVEWVPGGFAGTPLTRFGTAPPGSLFADPVNPAGVGLSETPVVTAGRLEVAVRAGPGRRVVALGAVAPWRAPADVFELPIVSTAADATGVARLVVALPPGLAATVLADGRLRTRLVLFVWDAGDVRRPRRGDATVIAVRRRPVVRGGVTRRGTFGDQRLAGTSRGDVLSGESGDDRLAGRAGHDALNGGTGNDRVDGGTGDDALEGGDGDDRLLGGDGADELVELGLGHDVLDGGAGDDVLVGGRASDRLIGGLGDDVLDGGSGIDALDCGPGEDVAVVNVLWEASRTRDCEEVQVRPNGFLTRGCPGGATSEGDTLLGTERRDVCDAGAGDDHVEGRGGADTLLGGTGSDRLFGRFGDDVLRGGSGDDELEGGRGRDRLDGGPGADQLNGGFDPDVLLGGGGDDTVTARGGGRDRVDCGTGDDVAYVDSTDRVTGCETVERSGALR